jgi:hypothetical protein
VHLQLDADTFSPLQRSYDAKEVLGARVPARPKHPLQARRGDLRFTGQFAKANRCVDVVTQDSAACSKVTIVDELEPFTKKAPAKSGFALCAFTDRIAEISCECHSPSSYLGFVVLFFAAAFASACFSAHPVFVAATCIQVLVKPNHAPLYNNIYVINVEAERHVY